MEPIPNKKYNELIKLIIFELKSMLGRMLFRKRPRLKSDGNILLHLGCGDSSFQEWINADFFAVYKPWKKYAHKPDWMLDLRFPLKCDDNVWDGVFTEHTLEHLLPVHASNLLKELLRTLKPSAWIRITVPDLKKYIEFYNGYDAHEHFSKWQTGCEAIRSLTQEHGHLSVWDSTLLNQYLEVAGFINIKQVSFMQGVDTLLLKDRQGRAWETMYMEAQKPLN